MIKNLQLLAIATASAALGAYLTDQYHEQNFALNFQQLQEEADALRTDIAQLKENNAQLNLLLDSKNAQVEINPHRLSPEQPISQKQTEDIPVTATGKSTEATTPVQSSDDQLLRKSKDFNKWLSNSYKEKGSFSLQEEMQQRFNSEVISPEWAAAQEQEYLTMFDNSPELAGLALREAQCRSQQCALTISISDINQANTLLDKMTATFKQQNKYPMIIATPDEQRGVTTLYIAKDENSFEFN